MARSKYKINRFDGGITHNRSQTTGEFEMLKNFDCTINERELIPTPDWKEIDDGEKGVVQLGAHAGQLYGVGENISNWLFGFANRIEITPTNTGGIYSVIDLSTLGNIFWNNVGQGFSITDINNNILPMRLYNYDVVQKTGQVLVNKGENVYLYLDGTQQWDSPYDSFSWDTADLVYPLDGDGDDAVGNNNLDTNNNDFDTSGFLGKNLIQGADSISNYNFGSNGSVSFLYKIDSYPISDQTIFEVPDTMRARQITDGKIEITINTVGSPHVFYTSNLVPLGSWNLIQVSYSGGIQGQANSAELRVAINTNIETQSYYGGGMDNDSYEIDIGNNISKIKLFTISKQANTNELENYNAIFNTWTAGTLVAPPSVFTYDGVALWDVQNNMIEEYSGRPVASQTHYPVPDSFLNYIGTGWKFPITKVKGDYTGLNVELANLSGGQIDWEFKNINRKSVIKSVVSTARDLYFFDNLWMSKVRSSDSDIEYRVLPMNAFGDCAMELSGNIYVGTHYDCRGGVQVWDQAMQTDDLENTIPTSSIAPIQRASVGDGIPKALGHVDGQVFVIVDRHLDAEHSMQFSSIDIKTYSGGKFLGDWISINTTDGGEILRKSIEWNTGFMFWAKIIDDNGDEHKGFWYVAKNVHTNRLSLSILVETEFNVIDFIKICGKIYALADDNKIYELEKDVVTGESVFVTPFYGDDEEESILKSVAVRFKPLAAGQSVRLEYKRDTDTAWTEIFTESVVGEIKREATKTATSAGLPKYHQIQFKVTSVGATITGFEFEKEESARSRIRS